MCTGKGGPDMKKGDDSKKQQPPQQPPQQPEPKKDMGPKDMGPKVRAWLFLQLILLSSRQGQCCL